jgi:hypothetical protein
LAALFAGTSFSADTGALMSAFHYLITADGARDQVARNRTGHVTWLTSVFTEPAAGRGARRTRLGAFVGAPGVVAAYLALLVTGLACFIWVTRSFTYMVACGVGASAANNTFFVIRCDDLWVFHIFHPAVFAFPSAGVATRQD